MVGEEVSCGDLHQIYLFVNLSNAFINQSINTNIDNTNSVCSSTRHCTAWLQSTSSRCVYQSRRPRQDHRCTQRQSVQLPLNK